MRSRIFYNGKHKDIQAKIKEFLNNQKDFLSASTARSTRAVGDAIQEILADNFQTILVVCY